MRRLRFVQDALAFPPGRGSKPARERGRIADVAQLVHQQQPDVLAGVGGIGGVQPVPAAERPDQRGVPLHQRGPRALVAVPGACYQGDHRVVALRLSVMGGIVIYGHSAALPIGT